MCRSALLRLARFARGLVPRRGDPRGRRRAWLAGTLAVVAAIGIVAAATAGSGAAGSGSGAGGPAAAASALRPRPASAPRPATALSAVSGSTIPRANAPVPVRPGCGQAPRPGQARCMDLIRSDITGHKGRFSAQGTLAPSGYGPADLRSAYNLPSSAAGNGETVAIIDAYDDPQAAADLAVYRAQYGLPACTTANGCFRKIDQRGNSFSYPAPDPGWSTEISLDLDMVSAICPSCRILLVEADSAGISDLGAAVNEAVAQGAKFVSNSYGAGEYAGENADDASYYDHPGVVVTASSGDAGYGVEFPAASPHVTAVGGTSLVPTPGTPRGWSETAWVSAGSGCSQYEPKPSWQHDSGCANRTVADVSAVADPATGVAVYDSYQVAGWSVFGGTSVAAPLIAATYALGGPPAPGNYAVSETYASASALNDITSGGWTLDEHPCQPAYLCVAGPGYDGITGLGTPDGIAAFTSSPHGDLAGTVTDASTGKPVPGAQVDAGGYIARTGPDGHYDVAAPPGGYQASASAYGYQDSPATAVQVSAGQTATQDFTLSPAPFVTVSGTVRDASGHGWPLYATVDALGTPASAKTDPATGQYHLSLPANHAYTLQVNGEYYGYLTASQQVQIGSGDVTQDIGLSIDPGACGPYTLGYDYPGVTQTFDSRSVPAGWSVSNAVSGAPGWEFDNPPGLPNDTNVVGNDFSIDGGNFALLYNAGYGGAWDTTLTSPVFDMSGYAAPQLQWDNESHPTGAGTYSVEVSVDGGAWTPVWQHGRDKDPNGVAGYFWTGTQTVPLPQAAGQHHLQVRFHFYGSGATFGRLVEWQVDNVFVGSSQCTPVPGGLVIGHVTDANTGADVNRGTVSSGGTSGTTGPSAFGGRDVGDGFYAIELPAGQQPVTASMANYRDATKTVGVTADAVTTADFTLPAGRLSVTAPRPVTGQLGGSPVTTTMAVTNTGTAPATFSLNQGDGGATVATGQGGQAARAAGATARAAPAATPAWTRLTDFPMALGGNATATDPATGIVYSAGGIWNPHIAAGGVTYTLLSYNPATGGYDYSLPDVPVGRDGTTPARATFVDGKMYAIGGTAAETAIYDPRTATWTHGTPPPLTYSGEALATLNGRIYLIGGCDTSGGATVCGERTVQVYDPATDTWSTAAPYPELISSPNCGAIAGEIYCAGGVSDANGATADGYAYDPVANTWKPIAPMPTGLWAGAASAGDGRLVVSGGYVAAPGLTSNPGLKATVTAMGFSYDPAANTWTAIPDAEVPAFGQASACGLDTIGGAPVPGSDTTVRFENLPGYGDCDGDGGLPWLTDSAAVPATVAPGQTVTVTMTVDPSTRSVTQPGTLIAHLDLAQDTPYDIAPADLTAHITPSRGWAEVTGVVRGRTCPGTVTPLVGATVQLEQGTDLQTAQTITTDADGHFTIWLPRRVSPLVMLAGKDGWQPKQLSLQADPPQPVSVTVTLATDFPCSTASSAVPGGTR